jgi:hypothetical protein
MRSWLSYGGTQPRRVELVLVLLFSAFTTFYLWGPGLHAEWWIIDDHEIHRFIGRNEHMPLSQLVPNLLEKTEIGNPASIGRFRPGYYITRLVECFLWGKNPTMWYAFRMALFFASLSIAILLLFRLVGLVPAILIAVLMLSDTYWADIFARLGPAETYAVFGLAIYSLAFAELRQALQSSQPIRRGWRMNCWTALLFVGTFLAAGSKENFTLLALPSAYLAYTAFRNRKGSAVVQVGLLLNVLLPLGIVIVTLSVLASSGADVYSNPVSPMHRLNLVLNFFRNGEWRNILLTGLVVITAGGVLASYKSGADVERRRVLRRLLYAQLLIGMIYLSQYIFYNGSWPNQTRYDFPGVLLLYVIPALVLNTVYRLVPHTLRTATLVAGIAVLTVWAFTERQDLRRLRKLSMANVERTEAFTGKLHDVVTEVSRSPRKPVVLEVHDTDDYEPSSSIALFLYSSGVNNSIELKLIDCSSQLHPRGTSQHKLAVTLEQLMMHGDPETHLVPFDSSGQDVFTIGFSIDSNVKPAHMLARF